MFKRLIMPTACALISLSGASFAGYENSCCQPSYNCCGGSWFGGIDFLYWKPLQKGIFLGVQEDLLANGNNTKPLELDYKWEGGFRIFGGLSPVNSAWNFGVAYTHYDTNVYSNFNSELSHTGLGTLITPAFSEDAFFFIGEETVVFDLGSAFRLNFNQIDFLVSREWQLCHSVHFRPFAGVRVLLTHEKLEQNYSAIVNGSVSNSDTTLTEINLRQDYNSAGLVAGFEGAWSLGCGLEFYGGFDLALVYGRFKIADDIFTQDASTNFSLNYSHYGDILNTDLMIGFRWNTDFNNGAQNLTVRFGWEEHMFANLNRWSQADVPGTIDIVQGDLYLRGFILGANVSF